MPDPAATTEPLRPNAARILFRTGRGLGDAVLCEPLVRAVIAAYPFAELTVMFPPACAGLQQFGFRGHRFTKWLEKESFYENLYGYDLVIDADPAEYAGEFHEVRPNGPDIVRLFAHYRAEAVQTTAYERMAEGLARVGVEASDDVPALKLTVGQLEGAASDLHRKGIRGGSPQIVIHPGSSAGFTFKRWSAEGFSFVGEALIERYDANVVYVGSGAESELIDSIVELMECKRKPLVVLDWTMPEIVGLLAHADMFIGNDSGVGHLAAALGRPVVTIAGPTFAYFWGPLTDRALVVDPQGCCYEPESCNVRCLKAIRGCEVLGASDALLTATTRRERYDCLDPIRVADDIEIDRQGPDRLVLRSRLWNMPLGVDRGSEAVLDFLASVQSTGSARKVLDLNPDADRLLEQLIRHGIVLPNYCKENVNYVA